jgi:ABC-type cobalt transport system, ATPase component
MPIEVNNLSYTYSVGTPYEKEAVTNVSFKIEDGETVGLIGSTGSGKSTLIQHLNGLIRLTSGSVIVGDIDLSAKKPDLKRLRRMIGMLFQYPEYQLFEDTVLKDVMFGPLNFDFGREKAAEAAEEAIGMVGLDFEEVKDKSPFELSGGEKRRAAIAGVLASRPEIIILDEPTAGLDPAGKREILALIKRLRGSFIKTVIMISHNMDEIAEHVDRVLVMSEGRLIADMTPRELFSDLKNLEGTGLLPPHTAAIASLLKKEGIDLGITPLNDSELDAALIRKFGGAA